MERTAGVSPSAARPSCSSVPTPARRPLPTGGSARFASALGPGHFRRRMAEVRIGHGSLDALVRAGAPIARAEGFPAHAASMRARVPDIVENPSS